MSFEQLGATKRDNSAMGPKLALRRHFLDRYHQGPRPLVFDARQGGGVLWTRLRAEYDVRYWGVDKKPKRGRLQLDSQRVLAQPGWTFDVVDIDTYGSPWQHWAVLLEHVKKPVTVFLTFGGAGPAVKDVGNTAYQAMGLGPLLRQMPSTLRWRLADLAVDYCLALPLGLGIRVVEAAKTAAGNAQYFGVRLSPGRALPGNH